MCPSAWEPGRGDRCLNIERCARVMKAICHTLLAELSYILVSGKEIETVNSERAANETNSSWRTHICFYAWQINTDVITKRSGTQETLKDLENIGHRVLPVILAALKDLLQGPAVLHIIQTELMGLDFCDSYWAGRGWWSHSHCSQKALYFNKLSLLLWWIKALWKQKHHHWCRMKINYPVLYYWDRTSRKTQQTPENLTHQNSPVWWVSKGMHVKKGHRNLNVCVPWVGMAWETDILSQLHRISPWMFVCMRRRRKRTETLAQTRPQYWMLIRS